MLLKVPSQRSFPQNKAMIFIGNMGSDEILPTAIHEFGHFHASSMTILPHIFYKNNLDIAEIQSQGLRAYLHPILR